MFSSHLSCFNLRMLFFGFLLLATGNLSLAEGQLKKPNLKRSKVCHVHGEVKNQDGVLFPNSRILFKKANFEQEIQADNTGKYSVNLPEGVYEITIKLSDTLVYQRARLYVEGQESLLINLFGFPTVIYDCIDEPSTSLDFNLAELATPFVIDPKLNVVIAYADKKETGDIITYKVATLTYNNYTLYSSKLRQNTKERSFIADGPIIWVEDGKRRYEKGFFKTGKILLKFTDAGVTIMDFQAAQLSYLAPHSQRFVHRQ